jgi:hypothetical protein
MPSSRRHRQTPAACSAIGTLLPRANAAGCPQRAKAEFQSGARAPGTSYWLVTDVSRFPGAIELARRGGPTAQVDRKQRRSRGRPFLRRGGHPIGPALVCK